jgi:hypothetical protein
MTLRTACVWFALLAAVWPVHGEPVVPTQPKRAVTSEVLRPFDAQDFALAYDVLLGAGDLQRAFLVAQQAVLALPQDRTWRRKLAQVSEWTQRPDVAAQQWLALFKQGDRANDTVLAVIRLAPLADEPLVAIQAWHERAKQHPLTDVQWRDVYTLFEAAAEPAQGSLFFEAQFRLTQNPVLLAYAASLAENAGDDDRSLRLLVQRADIQPFSMAIVLKAVVNLVRRDKMPEALSLMQAHAQQVPAEAVEFWRLLGQVAWEARDYGVAQSAYSKYARLPQATPADWSRLVFLVRQQHPAEAADLALQAYRRFGAVDQLLLGLGLYVELGDMAAQARVYGALDTKTEAQAKQAPRFLLMRAQFHQRQKKADLAWTDLRDALKQSPKDNDVVLAALWFLIDAQRVALLPAFLRVHASQAALDPAYWQAYAVANQVLEQHKAAVYWYAKVVAQNTDDPLVLLNYADALERTNQRGMADRMRRHAWQLLKDKYPTPQSVQGLAQNPELLALARLSLQNQPGDPSLGLVSQWVAEMRGLPDVQQNEQTLALVLGWAIVKEQFHNARAWLWRRYASQTHLAAPLWGLSQTALQLKDTLTMDALLSRQSEGLPIYNRYDTAYELGHVQQALDIAFKGMTHQEDEPLYDRFRQHAPLHVNYLQLGLNIDNQGSFDSRQLHFETRLVINSRVHLVLNGLSQQQSASEPVLAALAPSTERLMSAKLLWLRAKGATSLTLARRDELAGLTSFRLGQTMQWGGRLNLEAGVDWHTESTVSQPMRVAGYENGVSGSANYTLGKREYFRIAPRFTRYFTQLGDALGSGSALEMEFGYRIRTEYPDWRWRGFVSRQQFSRNNGLNAPALGRLPTEVQVAVNNGTLDPVAYFIPESSSTWGTCVGMGDNVGGQGLQSTYSRAWRPFLDFCFNHNTLGGSGLNSTLGLAGSIMGEDHLLMQLQNSDGTQPGSSATNALAVRYRRYF